MRPGVRRTGTRGRPEVVKVPRWSAEGRAPYVTGRWTPRKRHSVPEHGTPGVRRIRTRAPFRRSTSPLGRGERKGGAAWCALRPETANRAAKRWLFDR